MKSHYLYPLFAAYLFLTLQSFAFAVSPRLLGMGEISLHGTLNTTCIPTRGARAYLHLDIRAEGFPLPERCYRPMNVAVVLDRSGSMGQERKLDFAKDAVISLVDRLSSLDHLSIVIYDHEVSTILRSGPVRDKERIRRLIRNIEARGSTNLGGGMLAGFRELLEAPREGAVNRVILLSDGKANQGITNPRELQEIAESYRERSISLSAMGVGLEYNEDLMAGLAEAGGGNYYFIEHPRQLASIFERELGGIATTVAQNAVLRLTPGRGIAILDVIGYEWDSDGASVKIPVGDLTSNERREIIVELDIPRGTGSARVIEGELRYAGSERGHSASFSADVRYSDDMAEIRRGTNWDIQGKADVALSTRNVSRAMEALDEGRSDEAERQLSEARRSLMASPAARNSPAAAPMIRAQAEALSNFAGAVRDSSIDRRKVKKMVQFDNYQTQKKKP